MIDHLWQSTLFALFAWLLTVVLKGNRAQVRFWLWFSASFKFFVPFSLLIDIGERLHWERVTATVAAHPLAFTAGQIARPFSDAAPFVTPTERGGIDGIFITLAGVWACGFAAIALTRLRNWRRIRSAVSSAAPAGIPGVRVPAEVEILSAPGLLEPGVVGILHPILFLPAGIMEHLTPRQMETILAHELRHMQRRDNLFAAIHMIVEAVFWFHPLVWWIGARLVEERERACDEAVLSQSNDPRVYAEGILSVCRFYRESPLVCVSGVTGADLRKRIEAIMTKRIGQELNRANKFLLALAGVAALLAPLLIGVGNAPAAQAQSVAVAPRQFDVASIKPDNSGANVLGIRVVPGGLRAVNASLKSLIAEAYQVRDFEILGGPAWLNSAKFDIEAKGEIEPGGSPRETGLHVMKMLQALLADRFQLRIHPETKDMPIYALMVAKNGAKLTASRDACFDATAGVPPPPALPGQCHPVRAGVLTIRPAKCWAQECRRRVSPRICPDS